MRIGFIGLGNMGRPMAANLVRAGHDVSGFDLSQAMLDGHSAAGGTAATSVAAAVADADAVVTMLPAGKHVRDVYTGTDGVLASIREQHAAADRQFHDRRRDSARSRAPPPPSAASRCWTRQFPAASAVRRRGHLPSWSAAPKSAFARARPLLKAMGRNIVHAGDAGAGQAAKICNNMMLGISMIGVVRGVRSCRTPGTGL